MAAPLIGLDLTDPRRLADRMNRSPSLADDLFHPGERAYAESQPSPIENLAARFAAKEAVVKALGMDGFDPLDVEVIEGGERCDVRLHGDVARRAAELGVSVSISLTHLEGIAGAVALARPSAGA